MTMFLRPLSAHAGSHELSASRVWSPPINEAQTQVAEKTITPISDEPTPLSAASIQINGAGATFPLPIYTEWTYAYSYVDPTVAD